MDVLVFRISTIPDIDGARRLYNLHGLSDEDVAKAILHRRRQQAQTESLPHHLQKIVAISTVLSRAGHFKVWSLGDENSGEADLLQRFYDGLARYSPQLVSWGGAGFDLPVIQYRSLLYPLNASSYWDADSHDSQIQTNNNLTHFQGKHTDLKDVLSVHPAQAGVLHDEIATLCGFPGNLDATGFNVWEHWLNRDVSAIRGVGETSVLNTYLLYLNWQRNRGRITAELHDQQCSLVRDELKKSDQAHHIEFEKNWIELC